MVPLGTHKISDQQKRVKDLSLILFFFSGELHIVHQNTKYGSFKDAIPYEDGLAVLGILIEVNAGNSSQTGYMEFYYFTSGWEYCHHLFSFKLTDRDNIAFRHLEKIENIIDPLCLFLQKCVSHLIPSIFNKQLAKLVVVSHGCQNSDQHKSNSTFVSHFVTFKRCHFRVPIKSSPPIISNFKKIKLRKSL